MKMNKSVAFWETLITGLFVLFISLTLFSFKILCKDYVWPQVNFMFDCKDKNLKVQEVEI